MAHSQNKDKGKILDCRNNGGYEHRMDIGGYEHKMDIIATFGYFFWRVGDFSATAYDDTTWHNYRFWTMANTAESNGKGWSMDIGIYDGCFYLWSLRWHP